MAARGERVTLLPNIYEWDSIDPRARTLSGKNGAKRFNGSPAAHPGLAQQSKIRQDVWTLLHYRSSVRHRTRLQWASYMLEVAILVLITLNVALAMWYSSVAGGAFGDPIGACGAAGFRGRRRWRLTRWRCSDPWCSWYDFFLYVSTGIFTVEYLSRLWSCVEDERFSSPILGRCDRCWSLR